MWMRPFILMMLIWPEAAWSGLSGLKNLRVHPSLGAPSDGLVPGWTGSTGRSRATARPVRRRPARPAKGAYLFLPKDDWSIDIFSTENKVSTHFAGRSGPCRGLNGVNGKAWQLNRLERMSDGEFARRHCDVPKGTVLYAHGAGWVNRVTVMAVSKYVKRKTCGTSLHVEAEVEGIVQRPFFFSTKPTGPKNDFVDSNRTVGEEVWSKYQALQKAARKGYRVTELEMFDYPKRSDTHFVIQHAENTAGTALSTLFFVRGDRKEKILEVKPTSCGLEKMDVEGYLDFDGDGDLDVVIPTTNSMILLEQRESGFDVHRWGGAPCRC